MKTEELLNRLSPSHAAISEERARDILLNSYEEQYLKVQQILDSINIPSEQTIHQLEKEIDNDSSYR
jgi:hypothetical protein